MSGNVHHAARGFLLLLAGLLAPATGLCQGQGGGGPRITTAALPSGTVGVPYSQALSATGGRTPYTWSVTPAVALPAGLSIDSGGVISGTPQKNGTSTFTARVQDARGNTDTQPLQITVNNSTPVITTTGLPNGTAGSPYSAALAVSGAVSPVTWTISLGTLPQGLNLAASTGVIGGTPSAPGTAAFTVRLADSGGGVATAALSLTINPVAPPPLGITTASLAAGTVGVAYSQALGASGGSPPYSWSVAVGSLPAGLGLSAGGAIAGTPGTAGSISFTVRVTDSALASATAALSLTINPPAPPPLAITTASLTAGTVGVAYSQALGASGGSPPYSWSVAVGSLPAGLGLSAGGVIAGTPGTAGLSSFTVQVTDSALASATAALSLTVNPTAPPPLAITTASLAAGTVGVSYSQALGASGGSPPYSWSLNSGALPSGLNLSATGTIGGTPLSSGILVFSVQVADSAGIKTARTLGIQIQPAGIQITTLSLPPSSVGAGYIQALTATGGSPPFSWTLSSGSLPPGLALDPAGAIRGTATTAGSYTFSIQVADSAGASATLAYAIAINAAVSIATTSLADALIGAPYSQQLRAAGGTPPYAWSLTAGALPDGIKLDSIGGSLSGTPSVVGLFTFTLRAVDSVQAFADRQFQISTTGGLVITTAPLLPPATVGLTYGQSLNAAGGRPPYVWSISTGGLPAGVTLNTATGALGGVPSAAGSFQFTVDVSDSLARTATKQFSLPVAAAVVISSAPALPPAAAGASYSQVLAAAGGTPPYVWSITLGGLPAGLSFNAGTATISGVPTLGGTFTFSVQVTDNNSVTASKQFTITVTSGLTITTASPLPAATAGSPYTRGLSAAGGVPPYVWTVKTGSLPPGLALDPSSAIAGTPNAGGAFAFTLQVTDAGGISATRDYTLAVSLPPLPSVSMDGLPDPSNAAVQPAFSVSLPTAYPVQLTGQIVLTFTPDADVPIDDPSVQFATGGRTVNFTIPAGSTTSVFSTSQMALQTGTVSGIITLNLSLQSPKGEVTATSSRTVHVPRAAPVARALQVVHTTAGFELHITGYSTPRQLTQAVVQLTPSAGSNLQTTQLTIPLTDLAGGWYRSAASSQFGSQFTLVLPFTIQGNAAGIDSVGVSLVNNQGSSSAVSSKF